MDHKELGITNEFERQSQTAECWKQTIRSGKIGGESNLSYFINSKIQWDVVILLPHYNSPSLMPLSYFVTAVSSTR